MNANQQEVLWKYTEYNEVYIIKNLYPGDRFYKSVLVVNNEATAQAIIKLIEEDKRYHDNN